MMDVKVQEKTKSPWHNSWKVPQTYGQQKRTGRREEENTIVV